MDRCQIRVLCRTRSPYGRVEHVSWISSRVALLTRTTDEGPRPIGQKGPWSYFLFDRVSLRETPFPLQPVRIKIKANRNPILSPDLQWLLWVDNVYTMRGNVTTWEGRLVHRWSQKHFVDRVQWTTDGRSVIVQGSNITDSELRQAGPRRGNPYVRIQIENIVGKEPAKIILLPTFRNRSEFGGPVALSRQIAVADNQFSYEGVPDTGGKYVGERWYIDRAVPTCEKVAFDFPRGLRFLGRAFSSDGQWIAWALAEGKGWIPQLWLSRYDGTQMHPLTFGGQKYAFKRHVGGGVDRGELNWIPDCDKFTFVHEGDLYLIEGCC